MAQKEIKRQIINKTCRWQSLAAGRWNYAVGQEMDAIDRELDALYELLEDKSWNWYDGVA